MIQEISKENQNKIEENNNINFKDNTQLLLNENCINELKSVNDGLLLDEKNSNNLSLNSKKTYDKYSVIKESLLKKNIEENNNSPLKFPFTFLDMLNNKKMNEMNINVDKKNCISAKQSDLLICNHQISCCKENLDEKPKSKQINNIVFKNLLESSNKKKEDNYKVNENKENFHPQNMLVFNLQYPQLNNIKENHFENVELNTNTNQNIVFNLEKIRNYKSNTFENNNIINNEDKINNNIDINNDKMKNLNLKNMKLIKNDIPINDNPFSIENNFNKVNNTLNGNLVNNLKQTQNNSSSKK